MSYLINGYNDFYTGWIACLIGGANDPAKPEAWRLGWQTADETWRSGSRSPHAHELIAREVEAGHITIQEIPQ